MDHELLLKENGILHITRSATHANLWWCMYDVAGIGASYWAHGVSRGVAIESMFSKVKRRLWETLIQIENNGT